jgi:hypothetical protein
VRSIWNGAKLWQTGISSMVLMFTCGGWLVGPPRHGDDPVAASDEPAGGRGAEARASTGDEYSPHGQDPSE